VGIKEDARRFHMEVRSLPIPLNTLPLQDTFRSDLDERHILSARQRRLGMTTFEIKPVLPLHAPYLATKRLGDTIVAAVLLVVALPVIGVLALLVKLTSRGPGFYTQTRVGKNGRLFTIFKIRTMINNCESLTGPRWSIPGDPRVTGLGQFLRVTHLDELPQLLNVLRGDMSLIGPRPERPEFLPELIDEYPAYPERLRVRPGVTGLAQVQLPADTDLDSVSNKLAYDLFYVEHASPWLDVRILLGTLLYVARIPYKIVGRLVGLPAPEAVEKQGYLSQVSLLRQRIGA
jgi:lipopolysaccharide/colanic/teichoic acid biosynthesis glycosyltransferase